MLAKIKQRLSLRAEAMSMQFASMTIVQSQSVDAGLHFVRRFSRFDEVAVGRSWLNTALARYVYEQHEGAAATPQLIMVRRSGEATGSIFTDEQVLLRLVGFEQIEQWFEAGASLPAYSGAVRTVPESR
jgi:hypothetical protein